MTVRIKVTKALLDTNPTVLFWKVRGSHVGSVMFLHGWSYVLLLSFGLDSMRALSEDVVRLYHGCIPAIPARFNCIKRMSLQRWIRNWHRLLTGTKDVARH